MKFDQFEDIYIRVVLIIFLWGLGGYLIKSGYDSMVTQVFYWRGSTPITGTLASFFGFTMVVSVAIGIIVTTKKIFFN